MIGLSECGVGVHLQNDDRVFRWVEIDGIQIFQFGVCSLECRKWQNFFNLGL